MNGGRVIRLRRSEKLPGRADCEVVGNVVENVVEGVVEEVIEDVVEE